MPEIDLGLHSVNATSSLTIPEDRWILLAGGPRLGPAVLFWGLVPMMLLAAFILAKLELTPLRAHHWFLLFLGLSQSSLGINLIVAGWLLALGWRERKPEAKDWMFNVRQVVLGLLTLMAIACVFAGIQHGLLGSPDMKIAGNGSSAYMLTWYQDIAQKILPQGWVISLPLLAYRLMMLAWALWAAISMLLWLQWGWKCFSKDTLWKHSEKKPVPPPPVPSPKPKKEKDA